MLLFDQFDFVLRAPAALPLWLERALNDQRRRTPPPTGAPRSFFSSSWLVALGIGSDEVAGGDQVALWLQGSTVLLPRLTADFSDWLGWGVALDGPRLGAVVLDDGVDEGAQAGLVLGLDQRGRLVYLSRRGRSPVRLEATARRKELRYRWPQEYQTLIPEDALPQLTLSRPVP
jgi:hypothetical protein